MRPDELRQRLIAMLTQDGASPEFQRGYLAAMRRAGWLHPNKPEWIRKSAALQIERNAARIIKEDCEHD